MLAEINASPGLTVREYSTRAGISPTYGYDVVKRLERAGKARPEGHRWYPARKAA
jgi:hypothetical protein